MKLEKVSRPGEKKGINIENKFKKVAIRYIYAIIKNF